MYVRRPGSEQACRKICIYIYIHIYSGDVHYPPNIFPIHIQYITYAVQCKSIMSYQHESVYIMIPIYIYIYIYGFTYIHTNTYNMSMS